MTQRIAQCIDLTTLSKDTDTDAVVAALCENAIKFNVAAVCVYPEFVAFAKQCLKGNPAIKVASVANFPTGEQNLESVLQEIDLIVQSGGDEIDVVFPYQHFKRGDVAYCTNLISRVRSHCGRTKTLKVILESGELDLQQVQHACSICVGLGADFIKTSTGKTKVSATPEAAEVILKEISHSSRAVVGFKASGGIKTVEDALKYTKLVQEVWGEDALTPSRFRIGASSLLGDIEKVLQQENVIALPS